jgi:hypothetical protein
MKVPRIDSIIVKSYANSNSKGMRIPGDLGKPYIDVIFQGKTSNYATNNNKLNFIA